MRYFLFVTGLTIVNMCQKDSIWFMCLVNNNIVQMHLGNNKKNTKIYITIEYITNYTDNALLPWLQESPCQPGSHLLDEHTPTTLSHGVLLKQWHSCEQFCPNVRPEHTILNVKVIPKVGM
jgi:hypothetical protein